MILQALVRHYEQLAQNEEFVMPGWENQKITFALRLNRDGKLLAIEDLREEVKRGKKNKIVKQTMALPKGSGGTSNVAARFLSGKADYMLGVNTGKRDGNGIKCFEACRAYHHRLLADVNHPVAQAILSFFDSWEPEKALEHPLVAPIKNKLKGAFLIFQVGLEYAQKVPSIRAAWQKEYDAPKKGAPMGRCMVTGEWTEIERLHPSIRGVKGEKVMDGKIVSFNKPAFTSYGHDDDQGLNAPIGKYAAFAYGAVLNHMLADTQHVVYLGDTTIVFWAEGAEIAYADIFAEVFGDSNTMQDRTLQNAIKKLALGQQVIWEDIPLRPDNTFYILGLSRSESRITVRFFLQNSFGEFARHLAEHHDRMDIVHPKSDTRGSLSVYSMLKEARRTEKKEEGRKKTGLLEPLGEDDSQDEESKDALTGAVDGIVRAILMGGRYPELLYQKVLSRIHSEHEVTRGKAAIIKAYLLRNTPEGERKAIISEVAQVKLNEETRYAPYVLGRMFAVLEGIQEAANPGINTTIRDRFFNSACCTPAVVFPVLIRLAQAHLKKLDGNCFAEKNELLRALMGMLDEEYPVRLNLNDQGIFQLGYYHQRQKH